MGIQQALYDVFARASKSEKVKDRNLRGLRRIVESSDIFGRPLQVTFTGVYSQGTKAHYSQQLEHTFVIGQTPEQIEAMKEQGVLETVVFEGGVGKALRSTIMGTITPETVEFTKGYDLSIGEHVNFREIKYQGTSNDGVNYEGTWRFDDSERNKFATTGTFRIQKVI